MAARLLDRLQLPEKSPVFFGHLGEHRRELDLLAPDLLQALKEDDSFLSRDLSSWLPRHLLQNQRPSHVEYISFHLSPEAEQRTTRTVHGWETFLGTTGATGMG